MGILWDLREIWNTATTEAVSMLDYKIPEKDLLVSIERKLIHIDFHILQALLQTIGQIASTHGQYKRSPDSMFKAFVSAGLK